MTEAEVLEGPTPEIRQPVDIEQPDGPEVEEPADAPEAVTVEEIEESRSVLNEVLRLDQEAEQAQAEGDFQRYLDLKRQQSELLQDLQEQLDEAGGPDSGTGEPASP
jgi:hypothetical protein